MRIFRREFSISKIENILFISLIILLLLPVITNKWFVTGDGPSHLYNSNVVSNYLTNTDTDFYNQYYTFNNQTEPNWFSHISLAFLLLLFPPFIAEKILIISYVLLFAIGLRSLIKQINPENSFLALLGLPFIFHHTFQMGFYNYSFGFVFFFFSLRYWLKYSENFKLKNIIIFSLLNLLLYFTHPVGLFLAGASFGLLLLVELISSFIKKTGAKEVMKKGLKLTIAYLPVLLLTLNYIARKGLNPTPNTDSTKKLYHELLELTSLIAVSNQEKGWVILISLLFGILTIYSIYRKIRFKKLNNYDAFFLLFIMMTFIYFNQPGQLAGGGILSIRLQHIPYLIILIWLANINFNSFFRNLTLLVSFSTLAVITFIRLPHHKMASDAVQEYISVEEYIPNRSTILPISFNHNGATPNGDLIADNIWLFMHACDYIGADKSLILFGNYEANTGYFPIIWKEDKNPYLYINKNEGIENQPPSADILGYDAKTGGKIDYVVTWCLNDEISQHPYTKDILFQLDEEYKLIYTSEHGFAKLYKKSDENDR